MSAAYWAGTQETNIGQAMFRLILPLQFLGAGSHLYREGKLSIRPIYLEGEQNRRPYFPRQHNDGGLSIHLWPPNHKSASGEIGLNQTG